MSQLPVVAVIDEGTEHRCIRINKPAILVHQPNLEQTNNNLALKCFGMHTRVPPFGKAKLCSQPDRVCVCCPIATKTSTSHSFTHCIQLEPNPLPFVMNAIDLGHGRHQDYPHLVPDEITTLRQPMITMVRQTACSLPPPWHVMS
jgi:hypothetical protein